MIQAINPTQPEPQQPISQLQLEQSQAAPDQPHLTPNWKTVLFHWWHRIALIILIIHGLLGLIESCKFIFIEFPELSHALELHQVTQTEVNQLLSGIIITVLFTCFTFAVALRLSKVTETTAHNIDLLIATTLIIIKNPIKQLLLGLDLIGIILYALN